ncbi:MAG TPA: carbon monoxide dehydrogenase subunit G [Actinomycetota bacterium]
MKVAGNAILHAPVETVYAALRDPQVLVRTIPGCERLEQLGEDAYAMTVTAGVASVRGTYAGDVRLTDHRAPHGFVLRASGSGAPGTVSADVTVELSPGDNGTTELSYDADAVVGGMIGGVGQRLLAGVAKRTAGEFFTAVDQVLTGQAVEGGGIPGDGVAAFGPGAVGAPLAGTGERRVAGAALTGTGEAGAPARADAGGAGPRVYHAPARRAAAAPPGAEFAAGVVLGAAAALLGALVGGYLARRAALRSRSGLRPARGR